MNLIVFRWYNNVPGLAPIFGSKEFAVTVIASNVEEAKRNLQRSVKELASGLGTILQSLLEELESDRKVWINELPLEEGNIIVAEGNTGIKAQAYFKCRIKTNGSRVWR